MLHTHQIPATAAYRGGPVGDAALSSLGGVSGLSVEAITRLRGQLHGQILRAWTRKDRAQTDAEADDAQSIINDLALRLARIADYRKRGRVPSVEA